jgi:hypothetical protein
MADSLQDLVKKHAPAASAAEQQDIVDKAQEMIKAMPAEQLAGLRDIQKLHFASGMHGAVELIRAVAAYSAAGSAADSAAQVDALLRTAGLAELYLDARPCHCITYFNRAASKSENAYVTLSVVPYDFNPTAVLDAIKSRAGAEHWPAISAAISQAILFTREAYARLFAAHSHAVGGCMNVRDKEGDLVRACQLKVDTANTTLAIADAGGQLVDERMPRLGISITYE